MVQGWYRREAGCRISFMVQGVNGGPEVEEEKPDGGDSAVTAKEHTSACNS